MQVSNPNNIKIYNLSAGKSLPEWLTDRKKRSLQRNDIDIRRRIQLLQDFEMPTVSNCVDISKDGQYILATGVYKPRVRCYDVSQMSLKFERCMDSEIIRFRLLSDDYTKIVFLQNDRYVEFHNQNGRYYRMRLPMYGRDFTYHEASTDLYFVGTSMEVSRINLELGKFMMPLKLDAGDCTANCCQLNAFHSLFVAGTSLGHVVCFDPRTRNRVAIFDTTPHAIAENTDVQDLPGVTTIKFKDHLCMAVGTATGQVLLYDLRSDRPTLVKDHNFCLPIKDIEFQPNQNIVLSCDSRILKMWDFHTGKAFTSIEPTETKINDLCVVRDTGMLFLANETPKILTYYVPALGPAPKWCSFLDSLTEELEENQTPTVYDDYKFLTRSELDGLGLSHLIGTDFVRAYMHGFFIDIRLYHKAKAISGDFMYDEYRQKKIREKIEQQTASRVKTQKLPKVNRALAEKLIDQDNKEKEKASKKKSASSSLLSDERFSKLFSDADFEVDMTSEEYRLLNPVISNREKKRQVPEVMQVDLDDEQRDSNKSDDEYDFAADDDDDDDDDDDSETDEDVKQLRQLTKQQRTLHEPKTKRESSGGGRSSDSDNEDGRTLGELCQEEEVVQPTRSAFGNMELTFNWKSRKADEKKAEEQKQQHGERKKLRRAAGKLISKKSAPKFWMGQRVK